MAEKGYVFSEYEVDELGIKFADDESANLMRCIGSAEEEMETKTVTKSCRGRTAKKITRGTGAGTVKISAHVPFSIYATAYGMRLDSLLDGIFGYGMYSKHKEFTLTEHVLNEDDDEKVKAYPRCVMQSGVARKVENGADEVAEIELTIDVLPDEHGNGMYEALVADLPSGVTKDKWMKNFAPSMVQTLEA